MCLYKCKSKEKMLESYFLYKTNIYIVGDIHHSKSVSINSIQTHLFAI